MVFNSNDGMKRLYNVCAKLTRGYPVPPSTLYIFRG